MTKLEEIKRAVIQAGDGTMTDHCRDLLRRLKIADEAMEAAIMQEDIYPLYRAFEEIRK